MWFAIYTAYEHKQMKEPTTKVVTVGEKRLILAKRMKALINLYIHVFLKCHSRVVVRTT